MLKVVTVRSTSVRRGAYRRQWARKLHVVSYGHVHVNYIQPCLSSSMVIGVVVCQVTSSSSPSNRVLGRWLVLRKCWRSFSMATVLQLGSQLNLILFALSFGIDHLGSTTCRSSSTSSSSSSPYSLLLLHTVHLHTRSSARTSHQS